jgi:hypothetical protein
MLTRPYNVSERVDMYRQGFANLLGASSPEEAQRLITQAARDLREDLLYGQ